MHTLRATLEDMSRDLDLMVFRLEQEPQREDQLRAERRELRRDLERLRDLLEEASRILD